MKDDFDEIKSKAKHIAEELKSSEEWEEIRKSATAMAKDAAELVKKYPLQSVLGAAAAGFLLSSLLNRKR